MKRNGENRRNMDEAKRRKEGRQFNGNGRERKKEGNWKRKEEKTMEKK